MSMAPALVVGPIPRKPIKYDLFDYANGTDRLIEPPTDQVHWENGLTWESMGSFPASGIGAYACSPGVTVVDGGFPFQFQHGLAIDEAEPFSVWHTYKCSPIGHGGGAEEIAHAEQMAAERLKVFEMRRVEDAIWTGSLHDATSGAGPVGFANQATILQGAGSLSGALAVRYAVAVLEEYISSMYGSEGVIHMSRTAASIAASDLSAETRENDTVLVTQLGTPVVAGRGYHGLGPGGVNPGVGYAWIYATPAVEVWRSNIATFTPESNALEKTNDLESMAVRQYVVRYDGMNENPDSIPVAGVMVNLTSFA